MRINDHLRYKHELTDRDTQIIAEIQHKIDTLSIIPDRLNGSISPLLNLIHKSLLVDQHEFIDKVFFDFYIIRQNTKPHLKRIYKQLEDLGGFVEDSQDEQIHLVNLYRNIVSDAFDPYLSFVVANLQFIEGRYISMLGANLGQGEKSKFEYSYSRLKPTNLFDGYNSVVRNAISHTGTDGIIYEPRSVIFRNIKRGNPSKISEVVKWSNAELREHTLQLMDFVNAIDACIEIVGFDLSDIIKSNKDLSNKFFDEILTREDRLEIHADLEKTVAKILSIESKTYGDKIKALSAIFSIECRKRNLFFQSIGFDSVLKLVKIVIPYASADLKSDSEVLTKAMNMIRFGIVAVLLFKHHYNRFVIAETIENNADVMVVELPGKLLEEYGKEEVGLYDMLHEGAVYINNRKVDFIVNFDKLHEMENLSFGRRFLKRNRN